MAQRPKSIGPSLETGMLSFARSLQITEGVFYGIGNTGEARLPIEVLEKGVRGQSSEDNAKNAGKSNPQVVEFAAVPQGCTAIELSFSVRVLPFAMHPHACDANEIAANYIELAKVYADRGGFRKLAELYTWNIANGRFAWRNRWQTDSAKVHIKFGDVALAFDPLHRIFGDLSSPVAVDEMTPALKLGSVKELKDFVGKFADALKAGAFDFSVAWEATMQPGQEIFPSQEYVRDAEKDKSNASRIFAKLPAFHNGRVVTQASMHSQKIGAALRHIDIWHGDEAIGAISVNPYGGVQETGAVLRNKGSKKSFYELRQNADKLFAALRDESSVEIPDDVHFVMANLVRGGVFGSAKANGG